MNTDHLDFNQKELLIHWLSMYLRNLSRLAWWLGSKFNFFASSNRRSKTSDIVWCWIKWRHMQHRKKYLTERFDWYRGTKPNRFKLRNTAWVKWNPHPKMLTLGNTSSTALQHALSKSATISSRMLSSSKFIKHKISGSSLGGPVVVHLGHTKENFP